MERVSVIIPNYNGEKYLEKCINSVLNQNYNNLEIIIIDDGSTDKSLQVIQNIIDANNNHEFKLIKQNNLNAAIARNEGIKMATGRYLLFLDSDDVLEDKMLEESINIITKNNADLLMGNFIDIDEQDNQIDDRKIFSGEHTVEGLDIFKELIGLSPVPSNKIYDMKVIKENNLSWGNVRIGQDLNFYLKYLACCKKIYTIDRKMYRYRRVSNSISRSYDFRIFDIVNSFSDVKKFYQKNNKKDIYEQYLQVIEGLHYYYQLSKQVFYKKRSQRNLIINYFHVNEKNIDYSKSINYTNFYKKTRMKFRAKCILKFLFASNIYKCIKLRRSNK